MIDINYLEKVSTSVSSAKTREQYYENVIDPKLQNYKRLLKEQDQKDFNSPKTYALAGIGISSAIAGLASKNNYAKVGLGIGVPLASLGTIAYSNIKNRAPIVKDLNTFIDKNKTLYPFLERDYE